MNWIFHSLLKLAHTHESWHREEIGIYISPEGKWICIYLHFFKATCFWIIMIRIYSFYTLFNFFLFVNFFHTFVMWILLFCNFKIFLRIVKILLSKVCYFWINHISRLRSVLSTYLAADYIQKLLERIKMHKSSI